MKKFNIRLVALLIVIPLANNFVFCFQEERAQKEPIFFQLDPEQQLAIIEQGIKKILDSNTYSIITIVQALKYLNKATTANAFLRSKKPELEYKLKLWAQEKFGAGLSNVNAHQIN